MESGKFFVAPVDRDAVSYGSDFRRRVSNSAVFYQSIRIANDSRISIKKFRSGDCFGKSGFAERSYQIGDCG